MQRFFIPPELLGTDEVDLPAEVAHQVSRVLRLSPGAEVILLDGSGQECRALLTAVASKSAHARITARARPDSELPCRLHVGLAALKGEKLDWAIQKLTELGAARVTLLSTERTVVSAGEERWTRRIERYRRIAREAAEQCGGTHIPQVDEPVGLAALLAEPCSGLRALLDPRSERSLHSALRRCPAEVLILIGPEGGFAPREVDTCRELGAVGFRLGRRVLRAETAVLAAAALVAAAAESGAEE